MPLRRVLVVLLISMIAVSVAATLTNRTGEPTAPAVRPPQAQHGLARTLTATMPRDRVVRAATGDHLVLAVKADVEDQVQIEGYDLIEPVDPLAPARFDFIVDQP